ncbi:MAG: FAD-dependent oxidoreductase, partial [Burkholderiaceae bacterium]|nr:FAD-dependent oxidoreductase [Burkholderiaceae bacterium]
MQPGRGKEEHLPKSLGNQPVVVIGGGIGGLVSALELACAGLEVIVVEKDPQYGGTTAWSGGWMWVPRNP